ncbi:hypothetical protein GF376_03735 [Candidatus Peregrinibacteria bacterium]|nr:hypothetical protein [Candidatus Peregrinibacteria bacterium]
MAESKNVYHSNFFAMGTRMDVVIPLIDNEQGDSIFNKIKTETLRLEKKLSRFDAEGEIYKINQTAHLKPVAVDKELYSVLKKSMAYYQSTMGYFDITTRPLLESYLKNTVDSEIEKLKENLGFDNIDLKEDSVFLKNEIIEFDLGGFGKGYALENIRKILMDSQIKSAFISFGESSILAFGKHPYGEHWGVGIKHLFEYENVYSFKVVNQSLSTSGITPSNQNKYGGRAHVINPKTGKTINSNRTLSVVSDSALDSEILSTALMVCEEAEKKDIIKNFDVSEAIEIKYNSDHTYSCINLIQDYSNH